MTERTLRVLEFTKIREQLAALALTPLGAQLCRELAPSANPALINEGQQETEEAQVILTYLGGHPLVPFDDVTPSLHLAEKGASLSPKALLLIAECLRASRAARSSLVTERENTPLITSIASGLSSLPQLEREITDAIISEEEIADNASLELSNIRRHLRLANDRVRDKLNSMLHSSALSKCLQDPIITVRNDRYVLPVKQEYRQSVPGLIHDQSSSGATLFIEPMAVVELGNEIKQWVAKEKAEIERILAALSAAVAPYAQMIAENISILSRLDFVFAKGALAREMRGSAPKLNQRGYIRIIRGRHPLIDPQKVVPMNLWMGDEFTALVVTGPNTGGKTVTLKTVGLFALMAQAGLQVPADLGTELSVFQNVHADIGDEQSIEQSLSTFSSHMTNIVAIMQTVTPYDLVLFDELGAGTDPTEGAALAQSILEHLLMKKVRTMATTHYSELKAFALTTKGVENASVEFDVETLRPTYRLSIGVPGKSNAFEISRKLGLDESLINNARELLSHESIRFEDVIANAEYHRQVAEKERKLAEEAHQETVKMRDEAEALRREMEEKRESAMRKAKEDARRVMENARRESEAILSELKRMKKEGAMTQEHQAQQLKKRMQDGIESLSEGLAAPAFRVTEPPRDLRPGDEVEIMHLNTRGTVLSKPDDKGEVQIQAGIMKLKAQLSQLRLIKEPPKKQAPKVNTQTSAAVRSVPMELDIRGKATDEALPEVDQYLDEAVLASLGEVSIIHGKGTGVLRANIQQHLRHHPHVKSFRLGVFGEGESGVTVVTLK